MIKDKEVSYQTLVENIDTFGEDLTAWDIRFISDLIDHPPDRFSPKQIKQLTRIYNEKC